MYNLSPGITRSSQTCTSITIIMTSLYFCEYSTPIRVFNVDFKSHDNYLEK